MENNGEYFIINSNITILLQNKETFFGIMHLLHL